MVPKISKMFQLSNKHKTDNVHEATLADPVIHPVELDNAGTTSATTGQTPVHTNDDSVPTAQHRSSTMSRWKKGSWNATKLTLDLANQASMFPPLQTAAGLLLNLVNRCEVRYSAFKSCDSRICSSKLTGANKDSIQSVVKRIQYLNDSIVEHGSDSNAGELKRQKQLTTSVSLMFCIFLYLIFDHPVD
jgi:hypothetical protein